MANKKIFKKIFDSNINKSNNYNQIISKINKKRNKLNLLKYVLIPVFTPVILIITLLLIFTNKNSYSGKLYKDLPVTYTYNVKLFDDSTPEKAIGISDYVFVAKVNKIIRTEYRNPVEIETSLITKKTVYDPYTHYSLSVIQNIKGELITSSPIELIQYGGLNKDGKSYVWIEDGCELFEVGKYYIFLAATWNHTDGEIIEVSDANRRVFLGDDYNSTSSKNKILRYIEAYKNEIIPEVPDNWQKFLHHYISKYDVNYKKN